MASQALNGTWLDKAVGFLAPQRGLRRLRARIAFDMLARHYEAASPGRRTQGWRRTSADANTALSSALSRLRENARDLVRNNPHAKAAVRSITAHTIGWGIEPKVKSQRAMDAWKEWADSTACDSDGRHDFAGLQKLAWRTVVESGEVLIRRRRRLMDDGLPLPVQLQVLEPDYLDTAKTGLRLANGGRIISGIEFNIIGQRVAYWMFAEHPGADMFGAVPTSYRVPAENVIHCFHQDRPGQVRGASWFAPVILKLKDWDEYDDAQLMKQKIAACLAVITSDTDGSAAPLGTADEQQQPQTDSLEPGMILNVSPGRSVDVVEPPRVGEFRDYSQVTLRSIAQGVGCTYEDLTGDYTDMPFSAARMSRLAHWANVDDWRWQTAIPQLCQPVWDWAMEAATILGRGTDEVPTWTAPPMPMVEPDKEGLAYQRNVRIGLQSLSEAIRERGYDPKALLQELADDFKLLDKLGLILDCDPRKTTQAGNPVTLSSAVEPLNETAKPKPGKPTNGEAEDEDEDDDAGTYAKPKPGGNDGGKAKRHRKQGA